MLPMSGAAHSLDIVNIDSSSAREGICREKRVIHMRYAAVMG